MSLATTLYCSEKCLAQTCSTACGFDLCESARGTRPFRDSKEVSVTIFLSKVCSAVPGDLLGLQEAHTSAEDHDFWGSFDYLSEIEKWIADDVDTFVDPETFRAEVHKFMEEHKKIAADGAR